MQDLLLDKAASLEHDGMLDGNPQLSPQSGKRLQQDERKDVGTETSNRMQVEGSECKIDGVPAATKVSKCAQGLSTPGLEEPNFFSTQVAQVINVAKCRNSAELSFKSALNACSALQLEKDAVDCSLQNIVNGDGAVDLNHENGVCLVHLDGKREQHEHFSCIKDEENIVSDNQILTS